MSAFDTIQKAVFSTAQQIFGDTAVWIPSGSETPQSCLALYKSPNDPIQVGTGKYEYRPYNYSIEYYESYFLGLKESVDNGGDESVTINGNIIAIREVRAKFDGKTLVAYGELNNPEPEVDSYPEDYEEESYD